MKISKKEQRWLLYALRMQIEDIGRSIKSTSQLLKNKSWTPKVRANLQKDLEGELQIEQEHRALYQKVQKEIAK